MNPIIDLAAVLFGSLGTSLGVAMLIVQHRHAPMLQRIGVGVLVFLCFVVAINGSVSLPSLDFDFSPSPIAVCFAAALSVNWLYRLRRPPKMKGQP